MLRRQPQRRFSVTRWVNIPVRDDEIVWLTLTITRGSASFCDSYPKRIFHACIFKRQYALEAHGE